MRVTQQTATKLVLKSVPWLWWLLGCGLWGVGILISMVIATVTTFTCDRTLQPPQCELTNQNLLSKEQERFNLEDLKQAEVSSRSSRRSRNRRSSSSYRVALQVGDRTLFLTPYSSFNSLHYSGQAHRINQFINDASQPSLRVTDSAVWVAVLIFAMFSLVGCTLLLSEIVICDFDKRLGVWKVTRSNLRGTRQKQYPLADIVTVQLQTSSESSKTKKSNSVYRVVIQLESGESVPFQSMYTFNRRGHRRIVERVQTFLGLSESAVDVRQEDTLVNLAGNPLELVFKSAENRQTIIADCQTQLQKNPYDAELYAKLAMAWYSQGNREQAYQTLKTGRARLMRHGDTKRAQELDQVLQQLGGGS